MSTGKFTVFYILVALLFSTTLQADQRANGVEPTSKFKSNLPPDETFEAPPQQIGENPPVYLDVDSEGNVYQLVAIREKAGTYNLSHKLVGQEALVELGSKETIILQNMENIELTGGFSEAGQSAASGGSCPLPSSFSILGDSNGGTWGFAKVASTNRPPAATTQWIVFDFYTRRYRIADAHMPVALFHEETMHGWGALIGNNSGSAFGCGGSSPYNSQIEAWIQYGSHPQPLSATWQNTVLPSSCGNEMYDNPVMIVPGYWHVPRYRMEMQTSIGHWVSYRILEYKLSPLGWETLTDWTTFDVDTGYWPFPPPIFNNSAEGIFILSTPGKPIPWEIRISNTQCGWF